MKKWSLLIILFLAATVGMFGYLRSFTVTDADHLWLYVTPDNNPGWELSGLKNDTEVSLTAQKAVDFEGTVLMRRIVTEDWLNYESIEVDGNRPVCVWVDNQLVFENCAANLETVGEIPKLEQPEGQAFSVVFSMNSSWVGKTITVGSSRFTDEPLGSIGFTLKSNAVGEAQTSAWVSSKTFPGAAFAVLSLLLFGLFLYRLTYGKGAFPLLFLAVSALVQMFSWLDSVEGNPLGISIYSSVRVLCVLLPLLYLSTKMDSQRRRLLCFALPLWSVYFISVLWWEVFHLPTPMWFDKLAYLTLALLPLLLWCAVLEHRAGNLYFGRFLILSGAAVLGYGVLFPLGALFNRKFLEWLLIYWWEALSGYPMPMAFGVFSVLLVILFLLAIWDLVESSVQTVREVETLRLRSELTARSLTSIQQVNETLATVRHDELHHLHTLAVLYQEDSAKAAEYAASLAKELTDIPSMRFTENRLVNAILSVQSGAAAAAGVQFEAKAKLPDTLAIPETDLSTVLMNLLANAVEAAGKAALNTEPKVSVLLEIEGDMLLVTISNTLPADFDQSVFRQRVFPTSKTDVSRHGYGISSARRIVARRSGELRYSVRDGVLTLNTAMVLDN